MPPEILWKTTMNPANRRLVQITIDNANCEGIFQTLMGDQVEPRGSIYRRQRA